MGRVKLKIKRLENTNNRQATYAKRKNGIMKKASELSILCDIDIILLMFSPSGKPSMCRGRKSYIEEVIAKFSQISAQERAKRKLEGLEALKKTFKKLGHDVNVQEFLGTSGQTVEDLKNNATLLQARVSEIYTRLSHWAEIDKINNVGQLEQMEKSLKESINQLRLRKENMQKQQIESLQCSNQLGEIPFRMSADQHLQSLSWIAANNDNQHMVLPDDPSLLLPKDIDCSASSSFGSYASYLGSSPKLDLPNPGQEIVVLSDMTSSAASMGLSFGMQYPYLPYNFPLLNSMKFQTSAEVNPHENLIDYRPTQSFEAPTLGFDSNHRGWASTSGHCDVTSVFDEFLLSQEQQR